MPGNNKEFATDRPCGLAGLSVVFFGGSIYVENFEKTSKNFEKGIDKRWEAWYNVRVANEDVKKSPVNNAKRCDGKIKSRIAR